MIGRTFSTGVAEISLAKWFLGFTPPHLAGLCTVILLLLGPGQGIEYQLPLPRHR